MLTAHKFRADTDEYYPVWGSWGEKTSRKSRQAILVIDDDQDLLEEICETLSMEGYAVKGCRSGIFNLHQVNNPKPDLILLDLKMNGMHGLQLAAQLASEPVTSCIPIIAMTGYYTPNEISRFLNLGLVRACVSKPIQPGDLVRKIETLI